MTDMPSMFEIDDDGRYLPQKWAYGRWGANMLNGPAVCAAAARSLERAHGRADFIPARFTIDLFKAAAGEPLEVHTEVVRAGRRIHISAARVCQGEVEVAQARLVQLRATDAPPGAEWHSEHPFDPPADPGLDWWYRSAHDWSTALADHQNAGRKSLWAVPLGAVEGEERSPFVQAVVAAESTSLVTNWGSQGIGYINADLTVALDRVPVGDRIGLHAESHLTANGISVGTATLFDSRGPIGTGMVTALGNAAARIDFSGS
ncbi:acyl-CoA thioesterase domain-containing protein [Nocardia blacklockiae]|uniref:acyl-CoA thioesterase domain-containing protein n=1 Tax=Nocardia blacklockiae TaxID=480036 RepID=UPI0018934E11|nr:acyl-CoA thioesterase domain-containing protein [Nocardia blacklockiae]MBF6175077.1 thioesterase family protein [Nocardia blacklockiae]